MSLTFVPLSSSSSPSSSSSSSPPSSSSSCTSWPESSAKRLVLKKRSTNKIYTVKDSNACIPFTGDDDDAMNLTIEFVPSSSNSPSILQLVHYHQHEDTDAPHVNNTAVPHVIDVIHVGDIIGAKAERIQRSDNDTAAAEDIYLLEIYVYQRQRMNKTGILGRWCFPTSSNTTSKVVSTTSNTTLGYRFACHRTYVVTPACATCETTMSTAAITAQQIIQFPQDVLDVVHAIQTLANHHSLSSSSSQQQEDPNQKQTQSHPYLIMINPFSGTKQALSIYQTIVQPMLQQANIQQDTFITQYAGHAYERIYNNKNNKIKEEKEEEDTTTTTYHQHHDKDISLYEGIILLGGDGIVFEVLQALKNRSDWINLCQKLKFGIIGCGTGNGLAASILHARKEKYNPLESTFIICKGYTDKLDLSIYHTTVKSYVAFLTFSWAMIADIDIESEKLRFLGILRNDIWAVWRVLLLRTYKARFSYLAVNTEDGLGVHLPNLKMMKPPSLITMEEVKEDVSSTLWKTIEADFVLFWVSHVSHAAHNVIQSPQSTLRDGIFRIMIVRAPCSRLEAANILLGLESGQHVTSPKVEFIECVAYRLEPLTVGSFNVLDGEVIESGPIQASVLPSAINFFQ